MYDFSHRSVIMLHVYPAPVLQSNNKEHGTGNTTKKMQRNNKKVDLCVFVCVCVCVCVLVVSVLVGNLRD